MTMVTYVKVLHTWKG